MGYFDPVDGESIKVNTETTAIALVMLHPWTINLSISAKKEALNYIKSLPQFENFKAEVSTCIVNHSDLSANTNLTNKLIALQNHIIGKFNESKDPLVFSVDNSKITLKK